MIKVGLFGIGLDTYWPQFEGLLERLEGYQQQIATKMEGFGADVVNVGLVSTVLPVIQKVKCPVVILNIQAVAAIDYESFNALGDRGKMTGEWLAHCQACSVPELANVFNRSGIDYEFVTGYLDDATVWTEIQDWIDAK